MTTYLITCHPGAIEWAERQGVRVDKLIAHLDPGLIQPGDAVIGTLLVQLAAVVCARWSVLQSDILMYHRNYVAVSFLPMTLRRSGRVYRRSRCGISPLG